MNFRKINVSKKYVSIFGLAAAFLTTIGLFLRKKNKKRPKGPNYAAGL
jgi:LPXTG-motif cell wall-anchored protein